MAEKEWGLFVEDEVCCQNGNGEYIYGFVLENSEFASSDEEYEEEDRLLPGTVKVAWHPEGEATIEKESKVVLSDRSLMPGDVIRKMITGENSPRGFVQDTAMKCHLRILGTNKYIYNVDSKNLKPMKVFEVSGGELTMDSWVGRPEVIYQQVQVVFADGARCLMTDSDLSMMECTSEANKDSEFACDDYEYYQGQTFVGWIKDFRDAKWVNQTKRHNALHAKTAKLPVCVQIENVMLQCVEVQWMCKGFTKMDDSIVNLDHPPNKVKDKDLDRLHMLEGFLHCGVQIGDKKKYVIKSTDKLTEVKPKGNMKPDVVTRNFRSVTFRDGINPVFTPIEPLDIQSPECSKSPTMDRIMEPLEEGATNPSGDKDTESEEYESLDEDFDETQKKTMDDEVKSDEQPNDDDTMTVDACSIFRGKDTTTKISKLKKKGGKIKTKQHAKFADIILACEPGSEIAVEVCYTFSVGNIMWQNGTEEAGVPSTDLYPIHHLDELEFFPGDFIVDSKDNGKCSNYGVVISCDHLARTCMVRWMTTVDIAKGDKPDESAPPTEVSVYDIKDHTDFKFRPGHTVIRVAEPLNVSDSTPAVGQIYRLDPQGSLHIRWPDAEITRCYPQELYIVGEESGFTPGDSTVNQLTDITNQFIKALDDGKEVRVVFCDISKAFDKMSEFDTESEWETEEEEDSDDSWETENEEEVVTSTTPDTKDADKMSFLLQHKRGELDSLLERAQTALSKLEDIFKNVCSEFKLQNVDQCFQDILTIYRKCRDLERIVKSSYFEDTELLMLIDDVKFKLRKEKCNKINRHLIEVFENRRCQSKGGSGLSTSVHTDLNEASGVCKATACVQADVGLQCVEGSPGDSEQEGCVEGSPGDSEQEGGVEGSPGDSEQEGGVEGSPGDSEQEGCVEGSPGDSEQEGCVKGSPGDSQEKGCVEGSPGDSEQEGCVEGSPGDSEQEGCVEGSPGDSEQEGCVEGSPGDSEQEGSVATMDSGSEMPPGSSPITDNHGEATSCEEMCNGGNMAEAGLKCPQTQAASGMSSDSKDENIELCSKICKQLRLRMTKMQEEVNKRSSEMGELASQMSDEVNLNSPAYDALPLSDGGNLAATMSDKNHSLNDKCCTVGESVESSMLTSVVEVDDSGPQVCTSDQMSEYCTVSLDHGTVQPASFILEPEVPFGHQFRSKDSPAATKVFMSAINKELKLLQSSLPQGIVVKGFEDRVDLLSAMIIGPARTPYEDAPFFFDIYLPAQYPKCPPLFHYIAYCSDRLNPNLYEDGNVCVSLLGTWEGKDKENWTSSSNLLQVLVSIQGLILVSEPYYNEAGYERQRDTQLGRENSKTYTEMTVLKLVQSVTKIIQQPPPTFRKESLDHIHKHGARFASRIEHWILLSEHPRSEKPPHYEASHSQGGHSQAGHSGEYDHSTAGHSGEDDPSTAGHSGEGDHSTAGHSDEDGYSGEDDHSTAGHSYEDGNSTAAHSGEDGHSTAGHSGEDGHSTAGHSGEDRHSTAGHSTAEMSTVGHCPPDFPFLPASRGFCLTMNKNILQFKKQLATLST